MPYIQRVARSETVRTFGPATAIDAQWWTGWSKTVTKKTLAEIGAVEVSLDSGTGVVLPDDLEESPTPPLWVAFLPSLDPTPMGWKQRNWFDGEFPGPHYDRNGNIGPTIWSDGRVVGAWAAGSDGEIRIRLDSKSADYHAIEREQESLQAWLAGSTITPRFRTPIERELST